MGIINALVLHWLTFFCCGHIKGLVRAGLSSCKPLVAQDQNKLLKKFIQIVFITHGLLPLASEAGFYILPFVVFYHEDSFIDHINVAIRLSLYQSQCYV